VGVAAHRLRVQHLGWLTFPRVHQVILPGDHSAVCFALFSMFFFLSITVSVTKKTTTTTQWCKIK
jgi:hypothetical protein